MGQKTNPNILRLNKTLNWSSKYTEKKSTEFYLHSSKDLELKKFIKMFFLKNGLYLHNCRLNYLNDNLNIFISYKQNFNSTFLINNINKTQKIKLNKIKPKSNENNSKKIHSKLINHVKNLYKYALLNINKNVPEQSKKKRRIKLIRFYKKFLGLKKNKLIKNIMVNNFLNRFFTGLQIFFNNLTGVTLILKPLDGNLKKVIKKKKLILLKKKLIRLKKYQKNDFFKEGVSLMFTSIINRNSAQLLATYIASNLKKLKKHNFFLKFLKSVLGIFINKNFSKVKGIKIKIKGRINGVPRAKHKIIKIGKRMSILSINSPISYAENTAFTANGTLGVKVWVNEKRKSRNKNYGIKRTRKSKNKLLERQLNSVL
jgi:ribosomal protein S3